MISFAFCSPDSDKISNEKNKVENPNKNVKIIFFGDSLTAGLGLSHPDDAFPALIGKKLQKDGLKNFEIINAGVSGDTTSGGLARIEWTISRGVDVFILELGANDCSMGKDPDLIEHNLTKIIQMVKGKNPKAKILLVKMKAFPNMGEKYTKRFERIYENISRKENVSLSPFLLIDVAGIQELNQLDGIHPTEKGHEIMAENIYASVKELTTKL
ncbi:MAG: arylesterase [Leptospiraceae bacterium]|nr:arylesterase [Leptospiraceae bacterium]MCP5495206.1 arylesterase [Leptospiraceae bacterium]